MDRSHFRLLRSCRRGGADRDHQRLFRAENHGAYGFDRLTAGGFADHSPPKSATISGTVFQDTNANGRQDTGEKGLSSWIVYLDINNDGKLDAGDVKFTTGSGGHYHFTVKAGKYIIRETLKAGFRRSTPAAGAYSVTVAAGQSVRGKNFGDRR